MSGLHEALRRAAIDAFPNGVIVVFDGDLRYLLVGPEVLPFSGRRADDMEGRTVQELFPNDTAGALAPELHATIDGERRSFDLAFDDRIHHLETRPLEVDGGSYGILVTQEVTADRDARAELERQNERLDRFAALLSHDLRNPMTVLRGSLELAEETGEAAHFAAAYNALDRMDALVADLLTLAREGQAVGRLEPVDLGALAEACWTTVATADAGLEVRTDVSVMADESRLRQLLENLFRNAIEHGGSAVTVAVADLEDGFVVEDDGVGIHPDDRGRIFDSGYSTVPEGTGLGLTIVAEVVDAHGWTINAGESTDGGARFEIRGVERA